VVKFFKTHWQQESTRCGRCSERGDKKDIGRVFILIGKNSEETGRQKGARTRLIAGQQQNRLTARLTGVHKRVKGSPVDRSVDRGKGTVDRRDRPTGTHMLSVGPGRSGRSNEDKDRSTDRCVLSHLNGFRLLSCLGSNPIRVSKSLGVSGYK